MADAKSQASAAAKARRDDELTYGDSSEATTTMAREKNEAILATKTLGLMFGGGATTTDDTDDTTTTAPGGAGEEGEAAARKKVKKVVVVASFSVKDVRRVVRYIDSEGGDSKRDGEISLVEFETAMRRLRRARACHEASTHDVSHQDLVSERRLGSHCQARVPRVGRGAQSSGTNIAS